MDIARLIEALARPETYPHSVDGVEIIQTHISVVALAGPYAYKVKKPLDLGFLDFTEPDARLHFCREEVRLNRRLAPEVYLGVVPLVEVDGALRVEGEGQPVEYAVKMERLPEDATLRARLEAEGFAPEVLVRLAQRVADFHRTAESGPAVDACGRLAVVAANARENLEQSRARVGTCLSPAVFARLSGRLEQRLTELGPLIEARAREHRPRDTHGDLHLEHVYLFPDRPPPRDLVVIDCVEFNERFRYADPVADMAFLVMDLLFHGRGDLASTFADAYFESVDDPRGRRLLPFYVAYRAAVRAKVKGIVVEEREVPAQVRDEALRLGRAYWLLALSELEAPDSRPGLVLVGGLPGTGKSTLATALAGAADFEVISSDRVRKELAGVRPEAATPAGFGQGLYSAEWNDRTYAACLERARALLFEGKRVIVDASFREAARRTDFLEAARGMGVRGCLLVCEAPPSVVKGRLASRRGGPSDADWAVYEAASAAWEALDDASDASCAREIAAGGSPSESLDEALVFLRSLGLVGESAR